MHGFNIVGLEALRGFFRPSVAADLDPEPVELPRSAA